MQESKENDASVNVGVGEGIGKPNIPNMIFISFFAEDHEGNLDLLCPQKDEVEAKRLKEVFLEVFLRFKGKKHTEDGTSIESALIPMVQISTSNGFSQTQISRFHPKKVVFCP